MGRLVQPSTKKIPTLLDYYNNKDKVLIYRKFGGLGDILMSRLIFEDFKLISPDCEIHYALPRYYFDAVKDHPFIDKIIDIDETNVHDYLVSYDISDSCAAYEMKTAPYLDKHRSDIWAESCGVNLTKHNMHINLTEKEISYGKMYCTKPTVIFCPISAMTSKNLDTQMINEVIDLVRKEGFDIFILHNSEVEGNTNTIYNLNIRQWMSIIYCTDYVISVDTGGFHCAGGMNKPTVGIFGWVDADVYGKYYGKIEIVQKHRKNGNWNCGPCYVWTQCCKEPDHNKPRKPCITEITALDIIGKFNILRDRFPML